MPQVRTRRIGLLAVAVVLISLRLAHATGAGIQDAAGFLARMRSPQRSIRSPRFTRSLGKISGSKRMRISPPTVPTSTFRRSAMSFSPRGPTSVPKRSAWMA